MLKKGGYFPPRNSESADDILLAPGTAFKLLQSRQVTENTLLSPLARLCRLARFGAGKNAPFPIEAIAQPRHAEHGGS